MDPVKTIAARDMALQTCAEIVELFQLVWPSESDEETDIAATLEMWQRDPTVHFVVRDDMGQVRAHSLLFRREVLTASGSIVVGALGGVCVHPDYRGRGWGADVARAALNYLPQMQVEVSLFQTPVPEFYAKLNCRLVNNTFFDGTRADGDKADPFSDKWKMIYPSTFEWPDGEIDLNGPEY